MITITKADQAASATTCALHTLDDSARHLRLLSHIKSGEADQPRMERLESAVT